MRIPKYQKEINELLRMKKQLLGPQGCSCQSQQRNEWKAHCLSTGIYALTQLSGTENANLPESKSESKSLTSTLEELTLRDLALIYLNICDDMCEGDQTTGIAPCKFWIMPDVDESNNPVPGYCKLEKYCHNNNLK